MKLRKGLGLGGGELNSYPTAVSLNTCFIALNLIQSLHQNASEKYSMAQNKDFAN